MPTGYVTLPGQTSGFRVRTLLLRRRYVLNLPCPFRPEHVWSDLFADSGSQWMGTTMMHCMVLGTWEAWHWSPARMR